MKLSDGSVKTVTAAAGGHLSKPGTTTLRMTGGVITAASSTPSSVSAAAASQQQASFADRIFLFIVIFYVTAGLKLLLKRSKRLTS